MTRNPLHAPTEALRFAIDFAQVDLAEVDPADVTRSLRRFLLIPDHVVAARPFSSADLKDTQTEAHALLAAIVRTGAAMVRVTLTMALARPAVQSGRIVLTSPRVLTLPMGELRDRFLYRLVRLLEDQGVEKVLRCPCGRLFFKVTRKEYCSTRCQSRLYMRTYRESQKVSKARSRRAGRKRG